MSFGFLYFLLNGFFSLKNMVDFIICFLIKNKLKEVNNLNELKIDFIEI